MPTCCGLTMWSPSTASSLSLQLWVWAFHWQPHSLVTHAIHLRTNIKHCAVMCANQAYLCVCVCVCVCVCAFSFLRCVSVLPDCSSTVVEVIFSERHLNFVIHQNLDWDRHIIWTCTHTRTHTHTHTHTHIILVLLRVKNIQQKVNERPATWNWWEKRKRFTWKYHMNLYIKIPSVSYLNSMTYW